MNLAYLDESLDVNSTNLYHLSIQISRDGLAFCILDTIKNKYIVLKTYSFEIKNPSAFSRKIKEIYQEENLLRYPYKSISAIYCSRRVTIVPSELYTEEYIEKTFLFNHSFVPDEIILKDAVPASMAYLIYTLPENLSITLKELFPEIKIHHHSFPFISNAYKTNGKSGIRVHINQNSDFIDILVINDGKTQLFNQFFIKNERDFLFYVLYIFEQLKLDQTTTEVILSGNIQKDQPIYFLLKKYIRNILFDSLNNDFLYSYTITKTPLHFFKNLLNLYKCE